MEHSISLRKKGEKKNAEKYGLAGPTNPRGNADNDDLVNDEEDDQIMELKQKDLEKEFKILINKVEEASSEDDDVPMIMDNDEMIENFKNY